MKNKHSISKQYVSLIEKGLHCEEFAVRTDNREFTAMMAWPDEKHLHNDPVLLLTIGGPETHFFGPNDQPANYFWQRGHRVVTFPLSFEIAADNALKVNPRSSENTYNIAIEMLRDEFIQGRDPFFEFIKEAKAVVDICIDKKWAKPGRIVVTGISRFAYLAFRLIATDDRLSIGGGFAPVTDWRDLSEFEKQRNFKEVTDLRLCNFVEKLAGKKVCLIVGNHDKRINTQSCCQFFMDLNKENQKKGFETELVDFFCTPDSGHTCSDQWFQCGMKILLEQALS